MGGVAFYALNWNDTADGVGMRLVEHDLTTNNSRIVYDGRDDDRFNGGQWGEPTWPLRTVT